MFKKKKKQSPIIKCPRCGNKCLTSQTKCEECDLLFSRLKFASNSKAKKQLIHFDRDYVVYTNVLPKDVSYWKLLVYSILLGLFGGHYYYVGKYVKGWTMSIMFVYLVLTTIFNGAITMLGSDVTTFFYLPVGIYAFSWIISIVLVVTKRFKVPILVDIPTDVEEVLHEKKKQLKNLQNEINKENEKLINERSVNEELDNKKLQIKELDNLNQVNEELINKEIHDKNSENKKSKNRNSKNHNIKNNKDNTDKKKNKLKEDKK